MSQYALLAIGGATLYYLLTPPTVPETVETTVSADVGADLILTGEINPASTIPPALQCDAGFLLLGDQTCCSAENIRPDGTCGVCPLGSDAAVDSLGEAVCCPSANIDSFGVCQSCPIGSVMSGDSCVIASDTANNPNDFRDLNINTGSVAGDIAVNIGISVVSGIIFDKIIDTVVDRSITKVSTEVGSEIGEKVVKEVGSEIGEKVAKEVGQEVGEKVAKEVGSEVGEKVAKEVGSEIGEKVAKEVGSEIGEKIVTKVSTEISQEVAEKAAAVVAKKTGAKLAQQFATKIAAKVSIKLATSLARASAYASTGVGLPMALWDLCMTAVSMALIQTLHLNEEDYEPNKPNQFSLSQLPDWAMAIITSIPVWGSIIDILSAPMVTTTGCGPGLEDQNGLCYEPAQPGWKCEAFLCYKDYPEFDNNGQLHTRTHITKDIRVDTGLVPTECPSGQRRDGGFCYDDPGANFTIVGGTAWGQCPAGSEDQGGLCSTLSTSLGRIPDKAPCANGLRDDGTSCWNDLKITGGGCTGGGCRTWTDGCCSRGLFGECYGCVKTECEPIRCDPVVTTGTGLIQTTLMERQSCGPDEDLVGGLCYSKCQNGTTRNGLSCGGVTTKPSRVLEPRSLQCGDGMVDGAPWGSAGLCYGAIPSGFSRQVPGLLSQNCPDGAADIGVGCQRATYTRTPHPGLTFGIRDRRHNAEDRAPTTCSQSGLENPDDLTACQSMLCYADEDLVSGPGGDFCVSRCRDGYTSGPNGVCSRAGGGQDLNGSTLVEDAYTRRDPRIINWGESTEIPTTSQTMWSSLYSVPIQNQAQIYVGTTTLSGAYINGNIPVLLTAESFGITYYIATELGYVKIVGSDGSQRYYFGNLSDFNVSQIDTYSRLIIPGLYNLNL